MKCPECYKQIDVAVCPGPHPWLTATAIRSYLDPTHALVEPLPLPRLARWSPPEPRPIHTRGAAVITFKRYHVHRDAIEGFAS